MKQTDKFQEMVEDCSRRISKKIYNDGKRLIIVHFVAGPREFPYEIRRSDIRLKDSLFDDIYKHLYPNKSDEERISYHNKALKNYIQYYARHNTFLTLVVKEFAKLHSTKNRMIFQCQASNDIPNEIYKIVNVSDSGHTWLINKKILDELIPEEFANNFWKFFYTIDIDEDLTSPYAMDWMDRLEFLRAKTLFTLLQKMEGKKSKNNIIAFGSNSDKSENQDKYRNELSCITSFQSMSIFMRGLKSKNVSDFGTTAIVKMISPERNDAHAALVVVMVSPPDVTKIQAVDDEIMTSFIPYESFIKEMQKDTVATIVESIIRTEYDKDFANEKQTNYEKSVSSIFSSPVQKYNAKTYSKWILLLINMLCNKVHEGRKLNFYFLCGDRSQFEDDGNIEFHQLKYDDIQMFAIPKQSEEIDRKQTRNEKLIKDVINVATCFIAKEHFPWFEDGKYALMWDVSSSERRPCGLVSIKRSSWEHFVKSRFLEYSDLGIPSCLIGCVTGEPQTSSIIVVERKNRDGRQNIYKNIVIEKYRWENNRLVDLSEDRRIRELEKSLLKSLKEKYKLNQKLSFLDELKKYIKWIADDPNRGSILVFINPNTKNPFRPMGNPWNITETEHEKIINTTIEDRIALMSHDGATIVSYDGKNIKYSYRNYLDSDGISAAVKEELKKHSLEREYEKDNIIKIQSVFPLSCVGTRRWSAALAAFKKEVLGVIVISQDGDIHYWKAALKNENKKNAKLQDYDIDIYYFSNTKECIRFSFEKGEFKRQIL